MAGATSWTRRGWISIALGAALVLAGPAGALVTVTDPDDPLPFLRLDRPTGKFDETGLSGFELLISSRTGEFRANDQYLVAGEVTDAEHALAADLGDVSALSGVPLDFRIEHRLVGGRHFAFRVRPPGGAESVLCWGAGCPPGSIAAPVLGGLAPVLDYNGLQIQVRAQEVAGASARLTLLGLDGVDLAGAALFDETVTPTSPGTLPGDLGRRGQWLLADDLDLVRREWTLRGIVTLSRPDAALSDLTKVRLAVDLVRDPTLPFVVPEPRVAWLVALGLLVLHGRARGALQGWQERAGPCTPPAQSSKRSPTSFSESAQRRRAASGSSA